MCIKEGDFNKLGGNNSFVSGGSKITARGK